MSHEYDKYEAPHAPGTEPHAARVMRRRALLLGIAVAPIAGLGINALIQGTGEHDSHGWGKGTAPPPPPDAERVAPQPHAAMEKSRDRSLRNLAAYERKLGHGFDAAILRTGMPRTGGEAERQATAMAGTLKQYRRYGVKPVVLMQPVTGSGDPINVHTLNATPAKAHHSEAVMDRYFRTLYGENVTSADMGTWMLFPQPNMPWEGGDSPADFKRNVIPTAQALKTHFGGAHAGVMLSSVTYRNSDWAQGTRDMGALLEYASGIPEGLVDTLGFEGLPWQPEDKASTYLDPVAAHAAARRLGATSVLLASGTFARRPDPQGTVTVSPARRAEQLYDQLGQAVALQRDHPDLQVSFGLRAENNWSEGAPDWSYGGAHIDALRHAVQEADQQSMPLALLPPIA